MNYNTPQMTVQEHQMALYNKLRMGYNLCIEHPTLTCTPIHFLVMSENDRKKYLIQDTKNESYRMLVINYSVSLIGNKKNDKYSLYFYPPTGKQGEVNKFIEDNQDIINKLYKARNKAYAHFDVDFENQTEKIEYFEIKKIIDFIGTVLPVTQEKI